MQRATGLDEKKSGEIIEYTVEETLIPESYEASVTGDAVTGYIITNTIDPGIIEDVTDTGDSSSPWAFGFTALLALITACGALFVRRRAE